MAMSRMLAPLLAGALSMPVVAQETAHEDAEATTEKGGLLSAVGVALGMKPEERRAAAEALASDQVGKVLGNYSSTLEKAYLTATAQGMADPQILAAIKGFAQDQLGKVTFIDHQVMPDGSESATAELDQDSIGESLDKMKARNPTFARAVDADQTFAVYQPEHRRRMNPRQKLIQQRMRIMRSREMATRIRERREVLHAPAASPQIQSAQAANRPQVVPATYVRETRAQANARRRAELAEKNREQVEARKNTKKEASTSKPARAKKEPPPKKEKVTRERPTSEDRNK